MLLILFSGFLFEYQTLGYVNNFRLKNLFTSNTKWITGPCGCQFWDYSDVAGKDGSAGPWL